MFFLFPIGHDELTLRGLPFATMGLMLLCLVAFLVTIGAIADDEARAIALAERAKSPGASSEGVRLDESGDVIEQPQSKVKIVAAPPAGPDRDAFVQRWGFVPDRPGIGILTHIFLHPGVAQLILSLVFLWAAGVKLEELWSRPVFLGGFVLFALVGALAYGVTASDSSAPLLGASGGIAGLMGAMLVRLGKSKIYFAYFFWLFRKPRYGTFDAPAYLMPVVWLLSLLGIQFAYMMMGSFGGGLSLAQWIGGFAAGGAAAFALERLRFEERVLKRVIEARVDPEEMPLVAFQRREEPARSSAAPGGQLETIGAVLVGIESSALRFALPSGEPLAVAPFDVGSWMVCRIAAADPQDAAILGGVAPPRAPAVILAFLVRPRPDGPPVRAILVDAARLKYAALLEQQAATPKDAFFRLVTRLDASLPGASFAGDRTRVKGGALPELATLRDLRSQLGTAARLLKPHSQDRRSES